MAHELRPMTAPIDRRLSETIELLQELIRNTYVNDGSPGSGEEWRSADVLQGFLEGTDLDLERYEPTPGRTSLVARLEGSDPHAPTLCLMGHTDVVPVSLAVALTNLGKVFLELDQTDKAAENIQKAMKIEKDNLQAMETWVELSVKKGNRTEAIATLNTLVDRYRDKNDPVKAAEFARYLGSLDENSIPAFTKLGELLSQTGDKVKAGDSFFKVALLFEKQDKKDKAMEFVRKTLELNPGHVEAQKRMMGGVVSPAQPQSAAPLEPASEAKPANIPELKFPTAGIMDLEQENEKPSAAKAAVPVPAAEKIKPQAVEAPAAEDLAAEVAIADNYVKQGLLEEAIEIYQQLIEAHPEVPELRQKLNQAYTAYVKTGEDVMGALEAEKKAKEEAEVRLRSEMEKKAQEEAAKLRAEMEQKVRLEAEKKMKVDLEAKAREEAEKKTREEMERLVRDEAMNKARLEAEKKHHEENERKTKEEMESRIKEDALKQARAEMERQARAEAEKRIREEADQRVRVENEKSGPERIGGTREFPAGTSLERRGHFRGRSGRVYDHCGGGYLPQPGFVRGGVQNLPAHPPGGAR